jgi:outer membrane immunogenic protein
MKTILAIGGFALALALNGPALAADMPVKALPPPVYSWTGLYIGVNGGYAWGETDTALRVSNGPIGFFNGLNFPGVSAVGTNTFNNNSAVVGGQIGYMIDGGPAIFGIEVGFDWMKLKGSVTNTGLYLTAGTPFTIGESVNTNWLATFLVRAGHNFGGWVPYITGGVAVADFQYNFTYVDTVFAPGCACANTFTSVIGTPAVGAGIEWLADHHWSVRAEYLYMNSTALNGLSTVFGAPPFSAAGSTGLLGHTVVFKESLVRGLISYKIN